MIRTAILVDGGFYRYRAQALWGDKSAKERAKELVDYCHKHLSVKENGGEKYLYRILYYDCPPMEKKVYHPFLKRQVDFSQTDLFKWSMIFLEELHKYRKVAVRLGKLADSQACYILPTDTIKKLCNGTKKFEDLKENDFKISVEQKGVDIKIGLDIASLAYRKQIDQIILISGDSDFVPISKHARREGLDFILDPMWAPIKPDLQEHIDGLRTLCSKPKKC